MHIPDIEIFEEGNPVNEHDSGRNSTFVPKFFAYSIDTSGITKKLYVYPPYMGQSSLDGKVAIDDEQLEALSAALSARSLSSLDSERFTLYEISLRESGNGRSVSFNFFDRRDSEYVSPQEIFTFVDDFDVAPLVSATQMMEKCVFQERPPYNPTWMFGVLLEQGTLSAVKAYIRIDPEKRLTTQDKQNIILRIAKAHGVPDELKERLFQTTSLLESWGFPFRIIGIDCERDGHLRYKLYFRSNGSEDCSALRAWLLEVLQDTTIKESVNEMFEKHCLGMWGIGLSLGQFDGLGGFQPYFLSRYFRAD